MAGRAGTDRARPVLVIGLLTIGAFGVIGLGAPALSQALIGQSLAPDLPGSQAVTGIALDNLQALFERIQVHTVFMTTVLIGVAIFAAAMAMFYIRERNQWQEREGRLANGLREARHQADLATLLVEAEPQAILTWRSRNAEPVIAGQPDLIAPHAPSVLAFGTWLTAADARELDHAVESLKGEGRGFRFIALTQDGRHVEADGRPVGGNAVLRLREITGVRRELADLRTRVAAVTGALDAAHEMLDGLAFPVWWRDRSGAIAYVNAAFVRAVEAQDTAEVMKKRVELIDRADRERAAACRNQGQAFTARTAAIAAGHRRIFDVVERPLSSGTVGSAIDVSEIQDVRGAMERQMAAHTRTLEVLDTAVAQFDARRRLVFYNAAFASLWQLDAPWLDAQPSDGDVLDRLRAERRLPEQANFRQWKETLQKAWLASDTTHTAWDLPDGRSLRVAIAPNPQGGATFLFDDITQSLHLEARYNALMRVQGETLDSLKEGVAVFGSDGRLRLHNPAFAQMWNLPRSLVDPGRADSPHIDDIANACRDLAPQDNAWTQMKATVVGLFDARRLRTHRIALRDGRVLEGAVTPLPDGDALLAFTDVTANVNVERALTERNEALERAARLRNEFVHHVSYQLRSPLNTIIGFSQLLGDGTSGPLNPKQREYAAHILESSSALWVMINDTLDLASIDAGEIELELAPIDMREAVAAATRGLADRLAETAIRVETDIPDELGTLLADGQRLRQILFNLISNAVGFSEPGARILVQARALKGEVAVSVIDRGRGIPPELIEHVFDRFQAHHGGSRHRGAGIGLSIVKSFVELHGGRVEIASTPGEGTTVTCYFPNPGPGDRVTVAAE
jgi:signal transduction histidine kinase